MYTADAPEAATFLFTREKSLLYILHYCSIFRSGRSLAILVVCILVLPVSYSDYRHYSVFYANYNPSSDAALNFIEQQPIIDELDMKPKAEELKKAINHLTCGKELENDSHSRTPEV